MTISAYGAAIPNKPGLFVQIVPPQQNFLSPAETDILGVVGSASWGPINAPTNIGALTDFQAKFGNPVARKYDLGTVIWAAQLQGAQDFRVVRVTDGTDTAAAGALGITGVATLGSGGAGHVINDVLTVSNGATIKVNTLTGSAIATFTQLTQPTSNPSGTVTQVSTTGIGTAATFTYVYTLGVTAASKYTGSGANGDTVTLSAGSQVGTWKASVTHAVSGSTETFDNIGLGLTGNALWIAIVAAVNSGNAQRGGSNLVVLTVGAQAAAPTASVSTLTGGTDGANSITGTILVGADVSPRTGMYALRKTGAQVGVLADCDTSSTWTLQEAFGLSEGVYMIGTGPSSDTISNAISTKASAGIDSYAFKLLFGDWCFFLDTINGITRLISPQGFAAGWIAANGPQFSSLNKTFFGIVGTQKTAAGLVYYDDDIVSLNAAGIDVIANPAPGGQSVFSPQLGHNSSSNALIRGDNYTRMTNFIAATINAGMGVYLGELQSQSKTDPTRAGAKATLDAFFSDLQQNGAIDDWLVTLDLTNNSPTSIAQGKMKAYVKVVYLSVIEQLIVAVEGGQSVQITKVSTTSVIS